jgi:hypothetical protein
LRVEDRIRSRKNPSAGGGLGRDAVLGGSREFAARPGKHFREARLVGGRPNSTRLTIGVIQVPKAVRTAKTRRDLPDVPIGAGGVDDAGQSSLEWLIPRNACPDGQQVVEVGKIGREACRRAGSIQTV